MESILQDSFVAPSPDNSYKKNETQKLRILSVLHLAVVLVFAATFSLTFIWCGWPGLFTILMIYSWLYGLFNVLFVIASHTQRLSPFKWSYTMLTIYIYSALQLSLCLTFFIIGCIHISQHDGSLPYIVPEEQNKYLVARYMVGFTIVLSVLSVIFPLYIREFKQIHVDEKIQDEAKQSNADTDEDPEVNQNKY